MALLFTTAADHERHSKMRLAITAIALGLVSLHASASLFRTLRINKLRAKSVSVGGGGDVAASQHYSDRDGVATDETMRSYSTRWQTLLTALCAGVGACVSLAQAVLVTLEAGDVVIAWLTCAIWVSTTNSFFRTPCCRAYKSSLFFSTPIPGVLYLIIEEARGKRRHMGTHARNLFLGCDGLRLAGEP